MSSSVWRVMGPEVRSVPLPILDRFGTVSVLPSCTKWRRRGSSATSGSASTALLSPIESETSPWNSDTRTPLMPTMDPTGVAQCSAASPHAVISMLAVVSHTVMLRFVRSLPAFERRDAGSAMAVITHRMSTVLPTSLVLRERMGTKEYTFLGITLVLGSLPRTGCTSAPPSNDSSYSQLTAQNFLFAVLTWPFEKRYTLPSCSTSKKRSTPSWKKVARMGPLESTSVTLKSLPLDLALSQNRVTDLSVTRALIHHLLPPRKGVSVSIGCVATLPSTTEPAPPIAPPPRGDENLPGVGEFLFGH
eukprot:PhM_4_TR14376/c0_g1_i1/m.98094